MKNNVSVKVKELKIGTMTDSKGHFDLKLPSGQILLEFSTVGYLLIEETAGDRSVINVTLSQNLLIWMKWSLWPVVKRRKNRWQDPSS
ncbi:CarboxypepD_reg-like domain-containing protein [Arachidicoccus rhizosphaerae]|uniref:CarboxypepD_reg-like domain-containing protein n=1 Tax=Arachidicoccus rhizosphaerae TaxID=551991 RepID=A0A1H3Z474_9BACT|nr:carboxypeptidase-like regulatory domain-containing protein [Arachidicoccus rhizosphaerae]SEA18589.1 CarboxypepD_reg-like domain-containing protein [Arachidicoccus rhizosphaerae]